jgi:hypothetical protein
MNAELVARALGDGVKAAALLDVATVRSILISRESISANVLGSGGTVATYEIIAVQEIQEPSGPVVELRVLSSDGFGEATAYLYVKSDGAISST